MTIHLRTQYVGRLIPSNETPLQSGHKVLELPKTREGWNEGEWAGFYEGLRARDTKQTEGFFKNG